MNSKKGESEMPLAVRENDKRKKKSLSYLVESKQQFLLKVGAHGSNLRVKVLEPINQQPGAQSRLYYLKATGKRQTQVLLMCKSVDFKLLSVRLPFALFDFQFL